MGTKAEGDCLDASEEDGADEDEGDDAGDPGVDAEGVLESCGDGVGLGHVADTEGCEYGEEGEGGG